MSEIVLLVVGALVGLLVGQSNEYLRLQREEKRAIGRALKIMLVIRRYFYAMKMLKELAAKYFNATAHQMIQFQNLAQAFALPSTQGMLGKYETRLM